MTVGLRTNCIDNLVIIRFEVSMRQVRAKRDIAIQSKMWMCSDLFVHLGHRFDFLMIRRNSPTHQSVRRWQPVKHIHFDVNIGLLEKCIRRIKAGRPCTDDCYSQWDGLRPDFRPQLSYLTFCRLLHSAPDHVVCDCLDYH